MSLLDWFYGVLASLGLWQKEATILFLGPDVFGKARMLYMLRDESLVQHQQTEYWKEFRIGQIKFKAFDLVGHPNGRRVCQDYFAKVDAVVYPVDARDWNSFEYCREESDALLPSEALAKVPFLVLGNKSDKLYVPHADECHLREPRSSDFDDGWREMYGASEYQVWTALGLTNRTTGQGQVNLADLNRRPLEVFNCSLVCKMDCIVAFTWLSQYIQQGNGQKDVLQQTCPFLITADLSGSLAYLYSSLYKKDAHICYLVHVTAGGVLQNAAFDRVYPEGKKKKRKGKDQVAHVVSCSAFPLPNACLVVPSIDTLPTM